MFNQVLIIINLIVIFNKNINVLFSLGILWGYIFIIKLITNLKWYVIKTEHNF